MFIERAAASQANPDRFQLLVSTEGLGRYVIDVSVPARRRDGERFPVILVTDGNWHFEMVQAAVHGGFVAYVSHLPPCIVVGVGYPADEGAVGHYGRRNFDFHGDWDMADEVGQVIEQIFNAMKIAEGKPELTLRAGGAPRFSQFLRDELLPGLAEHFPIDLLAKHTLIGHSSGGHYVLRAIFDPQSPFARYLALSPAFGSAAGSIQRLEGAYAAAYDDLAANIYVACGHEEVASNPVYSRCHIAGGVIWTAEQFAIRGWKSAHVAWEIMQNEDHSSCLPRAIAAGLRSVFRKRPGIDADSFLPHGVDPETDPMFSTANVSDE
jgi:predicted alpha/beta superfamily hydrolase